MITQFLADPSPNGSGLLTVYYVTAVLVALVSLSAVARQLLKSYKTKTITEEQRDQSLKANTDAVRSFGDKIEPLIDKVTDHEHRISWLEHQYNTAPPRRDS